MPQVPPGLPSPIDMALAVALLQVSVQFLRAEFLQLRLGETLALLVDLLALRG